MINRRVFVAGLGGAGAATILLSQAGTVFAAGEGDISLGVLTPLTGSGGGYGPSMAKVAAQVVEEVNAAGGLLGRKIRLTTEDTQTNPEAAMRSARKLIDIDKVEAIVGLWAGSETTAVAPLCWESQTVVMTVSGAETITKMPHQGYIFRTQPTTTLQGEKAAELIIGLGGKKVMFMTPQTPFADTQFAAFKAKIEAAGGTADRIVYDDRKPTLRSEVDSALRAAPDFIMAAGYTPDTIVLLRDLFRASFKGGIVSNSYAVNQTVLEQLPADVMEGIYTLSPSPATGSSGFTKVSEILGTTNPDPYSCQVYDQINLTLLAIAQAGSAEGTAIRDALRSVSQGGGKPVASAVEGMPLIAGGEKVDYQGASGDCTFTDIGDITDAQFVYARVKQGVFEPFTR